MSPADQNTAAMLSTCFTGALVLDERTDGPEISAAHLLVDIPITPTFKPAKDGKPGGGSIQFEMTALTTETYDAFVLYDANLTPIDFGIFPPVTCFPPNQVVVFFEFTGQRWRRA